MSEKSKLEKKTYEELKDLLVSMGWFEVDVPKTKEELIDKILWEINEAKEEYKERLKEQRYL